MALEVELITMFVTILVQLLNTIALLCQGSCRSACCCGELVHEEAGDKLDYGSERESEKRRKVEKEVGVGVEVEVELEHVKRVASSPS